MFQKASKVIDKNRAPKAVGKKKTAVCRPSARVRLRICAVAAAAVIGCAICGEGLCPYDPYAQDLSLVKAAPSLAHLFGTDRYGRDVLSRVIAGGHASVLSALGLVAVIVLIGTAAGLCGGWFGGVLDTVLMRIADVFLAFPGLVLALAAAAVLGGGLGGAVISLAAVSWPKYARLSRSQTLSVKEEPYIRAAVLGGGRAGQAPAAAYPAEYRRPHSGERGDGYRADDDGAGGAEFSGARGARAGAGVGQYDE